MGCKCKNEVSISSDEVKTNSLLKYVLRSFIFVPLVLILAPFVLIFFGWILFKNFVLSESISLVPMITNIKKIIEANKLEKEESA